MANNRIGGVITLRRNGAILKAKGAFKCQHSQEKKTAVSGTSKTDPVHGFKVEVVVPYVEGVITADENLDIQDLADAEGETIMVELENGKTFVLSEASYAEEAALDTDEGEVPFRFEGLFGEYI